MGLAGTDSDEQKLKKLKKGQQFFPQLDPVWMQLELAPSLKATEPLYSFSPLDQTQIDYRILKINI